jgi:hypothetical protein
VAPPISTGPAHQFHPAHRFEELIVSAHPGAGAVGAVSRAVAVDQVGLDGAEGGVIDLEPLGHARTLVVMDHVGALDQAMDDLQALGILEIEREIELAALAGKEGLRRIAHAVTLQPLDFYYLGAQIGQQHRAERTGKVLPKVDHGDAVQRMG